MNGWTLDRRKRQGAAIQRWKPWVRSTGPRTLDGRAKVARNAHRGALRPLLRELARALRHQKQTALDRYLTRRCLSPCPKPAVQIAISGRPREAPASPNTAQTTPHGPLQRLSGAR